MDRYPDEWLKYTKVATMAGQGRKSGPIATRTTTPIETDERLERRRPDKQMTSNIDEDGDGQTVVGPRLDIGGSITGASYDNIGYKCLSLGHTNCVLVFPFFKIDLLSLYKIVLLVHLQLLVHLITCA